MSVPSKFVWEHRKRVFIAACIVVQCLSILGLAISTTVRFSNEPVSLFEAIATLTMFKGHDLFHSGVAAMICYAIATIFFACAYLYAQRRPIRAFIAATLLILPIFAVDGAPERIFLLFMSPIFAPILTGMMVFGAFDGESWNEGMASDAMQAWWMTLWWTALIWEGVRSAHPLQFMSVDHGLEHPKNQV